VEKDHGRIEIDWLAATSDWAGLQAFGRVESTRIIGDQSRTECRYVLCSLLDRERCVATVRGHWVIENQQHWVLDVQFGDDACRTCKDHAQENLALIRRMALNLLRRNGRPSESLRLCAEANDAPHSNDAYRWCLLFGDADMTTR
jgi:predicted transposase YbfD/YdcC